MLKKMEGTDKMGKISEERLSRAEADFVLQIPSDRPVRILQVTDTQIIDASQRRYPERLSDKEIALWQPSLVDERMTYYLDGAIKQAKPDLIVHTGDFVYGEFDDSGKMLDRHIAIMERYGIPWTLALGNHERETKSGVEQMCKTIESAPHCLFKSINEVNGERLEGNGTFSILLERNGVPAALLYILDSGCGTAECPGGIHERQRKWLKSTAARYSGIPAFAYFHIGPLAGLRAAEQYGYRFENFQPIAIEGKDAFGYWGERVFEQHCIDGDGSLMRLFEEIGVKGVFLGHFHKLSASMRYGALRLTYGLKTGEYDSHIPDRLGGTLLQFPMSGKEGFSVEHIVIKKG